jgi:hypothetical protein
MYSRLLSLAAAMIQVIALKLAASANGFLWAFVSLHNRWGMLLTFIFCVLALAFGASAAKDLGRMGSTDWRDGE